MDDALNAKLENWLGHIAEELVLAEPGSDRGQFPIRDMLASVRDRSADLAELKSFHECAAEATRFVESIMDSLKPFTDSDLKILGKLLESLNDYKTNPSKAYSPVEGFGEAQEAAEEAAINPESKAPAISPDEPTILIDLESDGELYKEFINESNEHLNAIEQGVLVLEDNPKDHETLSSIFRAFHTFKGASGFLNLIPINRLSHELESLLDLARQDKLTMTPPVIDIILKGSDTLKDFVAQIDLQVSGRHAVETILIPTVNLTIQVKQMIQDTLAGRMPTASTSAPQKAVAPAAPVVFASPTPQPQLSTEVGILSHPVQQQPKAPAPENKKAEGGAISTVGTQSTASVKVDTLKLDGLIDLVGELVIAQSQVAQDDDLMTLQSQKLSRNMSQLGRITNELQKIAMSLRMVPIRNTFQKMNRLVRDTTVRIGKQADLKIIGEDTEMDRTIVEDISDPLMHMIRNSLDHGIETPEKRVSAGKSPIGTIWLSAYHQGGNIVIEIKDDGAGLNTERIISKAIEKGIIAPDAKLEQKDIFALIFAAGFSTAEQITDLSGRGVGMDVVKKNINKLRGKIEIESHAGQGSTFKIYLPLTLAIIDGLIVKIGDQRYIVPTLCVRESFRPTPDMLSSVHERGEMVSVRGRLYPLLRLYDNFGLEPKSKNPIDGIVLVVESGHDVRCVLVDDLIGKQEVVIKSLGEQFKRNKALAGAAILGDGQVGLIMDPSALVTLDFFA